MMINTAVGKSEKYDCPAPPRSGRGNAAVTFQVGMRIDRARVGRPAVKIVISWVQWPGGTPPERVLFQLVGETLTLRPASADDPLARVPRAKSCAEVAWPRPADYGLRETTTARVIDGAVVIYLPAAFRLDLPSGSFLPVRRAPKVAEKKPKPQREPINTARKKQQVVVSFANDEALIAEAIAAGKVHKLPMGSARCLHVFADGRRCTAPAEPGRDNCKQHSTRSAIRASRRRVHNKIFHWQMAAMKLFHQSN